MQVREGKVKNVTCKAAGELMQVGSQVIEHAYALVLDLPHRCSIVQGCV